ncbi:hypothetical protein B0T22DRAFT_532565 [Podospora appendiculata]|uniref:Uncharacterized protein n=1 Tax=Podospora appendiculata TaxID=314037 RepID=A0AAE1CGA7_9PEZI|nr:hypothetical protein B0T22DRAFT_532565 [Podospora appendiculata]
MKGGRRSSLTGSPQGVADISLARCYDQENQRVLETVRVKRNYGILSRVPEAPGPRVRPVCPEARDLRDLQSRGFNDWPWGFRLPHYCAVTARDTGAWLRMIEIQTLPSRILAVSTADVEFHPENPPRGIRSNFRLKTNHLTELFVFEGHRRVLGDDTRIPPGRGKPLPDIYLLVTAG